MELGVYLRKWHGNHQNEIGFINVLMHVFSVQWQPRKMHVHLMIYRGFEEGGSASPDAYKPNAFSIIWGTFLRK